MKRIKTFAQFRKTIEELDNELKDAKTENELIHKHFKLIKLKRNTMLMQNGIEKDNDELVFERFEINPESPSGGFGNDVTSVSGCGSMNIDSGNGPTSIFSILVGLCLYLVIMGGMRQFVSIP